MPIAANCTITREFTKEQLIAEARANIETMTANLSGGITDSPRRVARNLRLNEIALASLEAEPVGEVVLGEYDDCGCHPDARVACIAADGQADWENFKDGARLYAAPPAPVSVPLAIHDEDFEKALSVLNDTLDDCGDSERGLLLALDKAGIEVRSDTCRAAMLQGADGNAPVIPDGWVMVPEEPTHEMLEAGDEQFGTYDVYRRMIAASPQQK
ncbi:hypothetical protein QM101_09910 [Enterobacter hormaechei]|uniref:hypothetical protein n=1 Tax=Enterobacter hormaechei TaxID=158836 RepID=UPI00079A6461|nr:hypothetical protein [Enterobacter hormaechei]MCM8155465.1 hypothetical protein [Enterobacter hormaechei]MCV3636657.1 hypothetical protein [Enterobacter hormaechei]MDV5282074.1 hypothetical protein [Enterobacter hormaechei]MDV5314429.1 hypothetical protein [Enterobacter hormaechei]MDV5380714.1 hypothetical protein [Enterobacter hormaechei]